MPKYPVHYPSRISFAGIDERTSLDELEALTKHSKKEGITVEFGVLLSGRNGEEGNNRYPSVEFMKRLVGRDLNLSLHLCGKHTGEIMKHGTLEGVKELLGEELFGSFQRVQINVVGRKTKAPDLSLEGKEIIIQTNLSDEYSAARFEYYSTGEHGSVVFLSDVSGGRGERGSYQNYGAQWQGYAGGINPDNVLDVVAEISDNLRGSQEYWVDLESGCRENDWFSTKKCKDIITSLTLFPF